MKTATFSWWKASLTKIGMLLTGVLCVGFIGWPLSENPRGRNHEWSLGKYSTVYGKDRPEIPASTQPLSLSFESRVSLNQGTLEDFKKLPGIGKVLAQRIISHRDRYGPFQSFASLRKVPGIGDVRMARLRPLVSIQ